jgi:FG-GAP-like repeat
VRSLLGLAGRVISQNPRFGAMLVGGSKCQPRRQPWKDFVKKLVALASLLVLGGSLGVAALFASSAPSFAPARSYATGTDPFSPVIGDLNGDGKPDLVTANFAANTVSVLTNKGDGSFRTRHDYPTGLEPSSVAIADLNGDRKPDLVVANDFAPTLSVLVNKGDGSFQTKLDYRIGRAPDSIAISDLNGDGKPDLATANFAANTVSVFANGTFRAKARHDYRTGRYPHSIVVRDLNGDRKPDLVVANAGSNTISVLINKGNGSFRPSSFAIGDLDGDRKLDLVSTNQTTKTVSVLVNKGNGSFRAKRDYRTGRLPHSVAIGDLSGDRKPDLVIPNSRTNAVSVLLNRTQASGPGATTGPPGEEACCTSRLADFGRDTRGWRTSHVVGAVVRPREDLSNRALALFGRDRRPQPRGKQDGGGNRGHRLDPAHLRSSRQRRPCASLIPVGSTGPPRISPLFWSDRA